MKSKYQTNERCFMKEIGLKFFNNKKINMQIIEN